MIKKLDITAIILAGGKSSRMGHDKGLSNFNNKPFVQHIIEAVSPLVNEVIVISNNVAYKQFGVRTHPDIITNVGPLGGVHSGLTHSKTNINLIISCDVPMISTAVIKQLLQNYEEEYEVIQTKSNEKTMPLVAIYHKNCLPKIEKWLAQNKRRVREFVASVKLKTIDLDSSLASHLTNINTPEELKKIAHVTTD